jgi:CDP-glycerol glycerophosphotransferase
MFKNLFLYKKRLFYYHKKFFWNILRFLLLPFFKQEKDIILFGTHFERFTDNTKYLFLYFQEKKLHRVFWITNNPKVLAKLKKAGYNVVKRDSFRAFYLAMKAGYYFFTLSISDVFYFKRKKTIAINLWHGSPLKKMGFDTPVDLKWILKRKKFHLKLPYEKWDYIVVANDIFIDIFHSVTKIPKERILPLGLPRNDILFKYKEDLKKIEEIKSNLGFSKDVPNRIIFYAPTFRDSSYLNKLFFAALTNFVNKFSDKFCDKNITLLVKLHPCVEEKIRFPRCVLDVSSYEDTQELLLISDILITDYSSVIFDYLILNKPLILFLNDYNEYADIRGLYFNPFSLTNLIAYNVDQLILLVKKILNFEVEISNSERGSIFNKNCCASERIANIISTLKPR